MKQRQDKPITENPEAWAEWLQRAEDLPDTLMRFGEWLSMHVPNLGPREVDHEELVRQWLVHDQHEDRYGNPPEGDGT